jgi:hypothetical protein
MHNKYVNHTGLMYELAPDFGALLIFAEHRYFGQTQPFGTATPNCIFYYFSSIFIILDINSSFSMLF